MKLWRMMLVVALVVLAPGCAIKGDLNKDDVAIASAFTRKLIDRLAFYRNGAAELDAKAKQAPPPADTSGSASPGPPDDAVAQLFYSSFELHARADILDHFLHEATTTGQTETMTAWLQDRSARLALSVAATDRMSAQFRADATANPNDPSLPRRYYELLTRRGSERGMRDEFATLEGDVAAYQRDLHGSSGVAGPMAPPPPML